MRAVEPHGHDAVVGHRGVDGALCKPLHSDANGTCDVLILDDDLEEFRATVRRRAEARIGPLVEDLDRTQRFSDEVWKELRDLELFALPFPAEVGGSGGSFLPFIVATEEVARVGATPALYPGTTVQVAMTILTVRIRPPDRDLGAAPRQRRGDRRMGVHGAADGFGSSAARDHRVARR